MTEYLQRQHKHTHTHTHTHEEEMIDYYDQAVSKCKSCMSSSIPNTASGTEGGVVGDYNTEIDSCTKAYTELESVLRCPMEQQV